MLKQLLKFNIIKHHSRCLLSQFTASQKGEYLDVEEKTDSGNELVTSSTPSILEPLTEDISHITTYLKPTFNVAAYANKSETIQQLVKLGVNIATIEKKNVKAMKQILALNFDDIKEHIIFLNQMGLNNEEISRLVTQNPLIFQETLDNIKVRITYLSFKRFSDDMITRILRRNPFWLSYSTQEIDEKLGFFQKTFALSGEEIRQIAVRQPQLITFDREKVKINIFVLKEEMGLSPSDMKKVLMEKPKLYMSGQKRLLDTFDYLHNIMNISLDSIVESPEVLTCRQGRLKERHQFLVMLGRDQFDARKPNYVAITTLIRNSDGVFATEVAKSSADAYNIFLKSL